MEELATCVERWVRDFEPSTKRHCLTDLKRFTELTGYEAPKFLELAKNGDGVETYDLIRKARDTFKGCVAVNFENNMRSFLKHNGVNNLPKSKNKYSAETWHR